MSYPNFSSGTVYMFDCCCEGRKIIKFDGTKNEWLNQDEHFVGDKEKHPFMVISSTEKNSKNNYITAIPITTFSKFHNPSKNDLRIESEMVDKKALVLVNNGSHLKLDKINRIAKKYLTITNGDYDYRGSFQSNALKSILERMKNAIQSTE